MASKQRRNAVAGLGLLLVACGEPRRAARAPTTDLVIATDPGPMPIATKSNCTEPGGAPPGTSSRERGIDAFVAGRPREAVDLLTEATRTDPRDRAAEAFRAASVTKLEASRKRAEAELTTLRRVALEPLPLGPVSKRQVAAPTTKVRLEKQSEAKNLITDFEDWESHNQLTRRPNRRRPDELPENVPLALGGEHLRTTFEHADHVAAIYETTIVIATHGRSLVFDGRVAASRAPRPFEIVFAQLVGHTLVVAFAYNGYAKESGGKNGYFAAFDATTGELAWATPPLVANVRDAVVSGGSIVTGYGFTAEPDFLFVLDLATGTIDQKIPLKSGPEAIRAKGDRLFVRTYDVDYVFKSVTGLAPAPAAAVTPNPSSRESASAPTSNGSETRCWVRRATAAIQAKDLDALHEAAQRLKSVAHDPVLDELLAVSEKRLSTKGQLDLSAAPLVVVPAPPWQAAAPAPIAALTPASSPKLIKIATKAASPVRDMHPTFDPAEPWFIPPVDKGLLPEGARADIPSRFGDEDLSAILPDQRAGRGPRSILLYGGRFVALTSNDDVERVFDLDAFRHPPKADPQWKQFAVQDVTYAQERDGVLYVCNGGGSYAKEVFGKKGFLSAIDATTGKLLWRSVPLTCNATFAMTDDHIVSGYGFTAEPDFVFLVRRSDGAVVRKIPLASGPSTVRVAGSSVHVESYGHVTELELR